MDSALNRIVAQEPLAVAQLFRLYGYDVVPTPKDLQNLLIVHGAKPLPFVNATGDTTKKKTTFAEILNMVQKGVTTVTNVVNAVTGRAAAVPGSQYNVGVNNDTPNGATDRVLGMDRKLFIMLAIILVIITAFMLFRKK